MKKYLIIVPLVITLSSCSVLTEMAALTKCEFSFHSATDPAVAGIDISRKTSWTDFNLLDGQKVVASIIQGTLPFEIVANVEVRNPGSLTAAVNSMEWIAFIDDIQVATGTITDRIEVAGAGGRSMIPVRVRTDLFQYLEGDNPRTMINFALNLVDARNQPTRFSMKIKPSVMIAGQPIYYPGYFTITKEFRSGS